MRHHRFDSENTSRMHGHHGHYSQSLHAVLHFIGRHSHGRGGGRFGGGRDEFGGSDEGMPRGRKFSSDDLQLLLLELLAAEPRHGYELIKALEVQSNGFYTPSPGMVYPALTYLEEVGHATVELEGNRKRYALAEQGRSYLAENHERVDMLLAKLSHFAQKMDSVRRAFSGDASENADDPRGWLPELHAARHALRHALFMRRDATLEQQRRIAEILSKAAQEIVKGP
jgi:DNA-binding PadR family transcriptional regulator